MNQPEPPEEYKERNERVMTAVNLKEPDRVPITPMTEFYPAVQKGIEKKEIMYNPEKMSKAFQDVLVPLDCDQLPPLVAGLSSGPGTLLDLFMPQFFKWPGAPTEDRRLGDDTRFQYDEKEFMEAEEYEEILTDPTGFLLRKILPRHFSSFESFEKFPDKASLANGYMTIMQFPMFFGDPSVRETMEKMQKAAKAGLEWMEVQKNYEMELMKQGYPVQFNTLTQAPYDVVSEFLRGLEGTMLDIYRHPEELKELMNLLVDSLIRAPVKASGNFPQKIVFIPLHRGADSFMSNEQFEEFYWPTLTKVMEGLIENDLIPMPFFEGSYDQRLEYLKEFAKKHQGKLIYWFDKTDIIHAKEVFGDYATIKGNIPGTLLTTGTPEKVKEYTKKIIDGCADGGGFLVDGGVSGIPDEAKPENVKAMVETVKEHGQY